MSLKVPKGLIGSLMRPWAERPHGLRCRLKPTFEMHSERWLQPAAAPLQPAVQSPLVDGAIESAGQQNSKLKAAEDSRTPGNSRAFPCRTHFRQVPGVRLSSAALD